MDLEYSVTETVTTLSGQVLEIIYEIEEVTIEVIQMGITSKQERRSRMYNAKIERKQYNALTQRLRNTLNFDDFVNVLRPFIMGHYGNRELEQAFAVLDKDHSGSIALDELAALLPIINPNATSDTLKNYMRKVNLNTDGSLNYDQFRALILKGIGRDIICNTI